MTMKVDFMSPANNTEIDREGTQAPLFKTAVTVLFTILAALFVASIWRWLSARRTSSVAGFGRERMMRNGTSAVLFD
jgi:hypothetical protein